MSTKKQYCKGYNYSVYPQTLIDLTTVVLENNGKYGVDKLMAKIVCKNGKFDVYFTDGFTYLKVKYGFNSLKQALNHSHAWMVDFIKELNERKTS